MIVVHPESVKEDVLGALPWVHYPPHYGAFISFSERKTSQHYFCNCARKALWNYWNVQEIDYRDDSDEYDEESNIHWRLSKDFHTVILQKLKQNSIKRGASLTEIIPLKHKICHRCRQTVPSVQYCHPMYGGKFRQQYGWYVQQKRLEYDDVALAQEDKHFIENLVRQDFGFKNVGEAWAGETLLYYMIKELYPETEVVHHYRPAFLERQEIDIYMEKYGIGIEYQGQQHFQPIKFWGGKKALKQNRARDARKKRLCMRESLSLVYFYYNENLTHDLVRSRIDKAISQKSPQL